MEWKNVGHSPAWMELTFLREILLMASEPGLGEEGDDLDHSKRRLGPVASC